MLPQNNRRIARIQSRSAAWVMAAVMLIAAGLIGCNIKAEHNGDAKNVEISTPFGGLKVRTKIDPKDVGLAIYPKARLKPSEESDNSQSANVNVSGPGFGLKVVVLQYESDDPPQKILDFYSKEMSRYGRVVQCKGSESAPHENDHGMTLSLNCDTSGDDKDVELKAGEGSSQHIVAVKPRGRGSDFGLVYIQVRDKSEPM